VVRLWSEILVSPGTRIEEMEMLSVTAVSGEGRRETKAPRKRQDAPVREEEFEHGGPGSASVESVKDHVSLTSGGVEGPAELVGAVEQSGDLGWDEEESEALRRGLKEAELTLSADSVRTYLKQIGKIALLNAEEEVELARRIEAGLYAAERLRRAREGAGKLTRSCTRICAG
jgi:RNA polymerase primary sigma factor